MSNHVPNLAIFCDFENVAIGVRDARYEKFDIQLALERILDKGSVVVKKAYADWDRYKTSKRGLHEASFELIEIPHVSISGKNSADIRLVVDALDLCYTKEHLDGFVIISGDSDFSPLVSKLRENNKRVIGMGVKNSSSNLLVDNCDEFIYYDDLVRGRRKKSSSRRKPRRKGPRRDDERATEKVDRPDKLVAPGDKTADKGPDKTADKDKTATPAAAGVKPSAADSDGDPEKAIELVLETVEGLFRDRDGNLWGSMVKQVIKRKKPHFSESYFGYRTFNQLLEDAASQEKLEIEKDAKSGGYVIMGFGKNA